MKAHRDLLKESRAVYVAAVPLADESVVKSVTAFNSRGKRMSLDAHKPPDIPTFVIGPAEEESLEPAAPLVKSEKPGKEENPERVVDDYLGSHETFSTFSGNTSTTFDGIDTALWSC